MTTTQQHSPAPWRVFPAQDRPYRLEIVDAEGCTIVVLDASDEAGSAMENDTTLPADAAVMAAAPKLLAGLSTILERLATEPVENDELVEFCRGLIALTCPDSPESEEDAAVNAERIRDAETAVSALVKVKEPSARDLDSVIGQSLQEYLVDLLADLRHWAGHRGLAFDQAGRLAADHHRLEIPAEGQRP